MTKRAAKMYEYGEFMLPPSIVSKVDLSRMVHEVEWIDNELTTKSVRSKAGVRSAVDLTLSEQLADFLKYNKLDFLDMLSRERSQFIKELRLLKDKAPVIHMTFATMADGESLAKLAAWARESAHPQALIVVGVQPNLVAGAYIRTPNHIHDFSLRSKLEGSHDVLVKQLEALRG